MEAIQLMQDVPYNIATKPVLQLSSEDGFMQANTQPILLEELRENCIIPSFAKDNESTISHVEFIQTVDKAVKEVFDSQVILRPSVRVSHPVKGRIPSAMGKAAKELKEWEKTQYFERMAFVIEVPSIKRQVNGNELSLTIGGVRAYNLENLFSRKTEERFKLFIGFKNKVCTNLCISTDGFTSDLRTTTLTRLYQQAVKLFSNFDGNNSLINYGKLSRYSLTEHEFAQLLGRMRLYQYLDMDQRRGIPMLPITDSQVSAIAKDYYSSTSFSREVDGSINLWKVYNLFTGANKSSYIDTFLDREVACLKFVECLQQAKEQREELWYLQ